MKNSAIQYKCQSHTQVIINISLSSSSSSSLAKQTFLEDSTRFDPVFISLDLATVIILDSKVASYASTPGTLFISSTTLTATVEVF
jgi:hypothetical protein